MKRIFTTADGLVAVDLVRCGIDHLFAAKLLFDSSPKYFDAAGYLVHIGVELLLKGWLLESIGQFKGTHSLNKLYQRLVAEANAPSLSNAQCTLVNLLDEYSKLRYPDENNPAEIGNGNWGEIQTFVEHLCCAMPNSLTDALAKISPLTKGGRVLMKRKT